MRGIGSRGVLAGLAMSVVVALAVTVLPASVPAAFAAADKTCLLCVMNPSANHALDVNGGATLHVMFGNIVVDSKAGDAADISGGSRVITDGCTPFCGTGVVGGWNASGGATFSPAPHHTDFVADPLAALPFPTPSGTNFGSVIANGGLRVVKPGIYSNLGASGGGVLEMKPGRYFITGKFDISGSGRVFNDFDSSGAGVTLFFPGSGSFNLSGGSVTNLSSGSPSDRVIFFAKTNTSQIKTDDVTVHLVGQIYALKAQAVIQALNIQTDHIIVDTLNVHSGGYLNMCVHSCP